MQKGLYLLLFSDCFAFIMNIFFILDSLQILQKETSDMSISVFDKR